MSVNKHVAVIGLGSGGSAVADMLARMGVERLTLVDPDKLSEENCKRHILRRGEAGRGKALAMAFHLYNVSDCKIKIQDKEFSTLEEKPDLIASCVDSLKCESLINAYALEHKIPVIFAGVHGAAEQAEIITVSPGGPCYECWTREGELPPPSMEKYTDPNYDPTKSPSMPGLWSDVLMAASLQVQAILGVLGLREKMPPLVLMSLRWPFRVEGFNQKERCAVCSEDFSSLTV